MYLIIPGFVYLLAFFFYFLTITGKYDFEFFKGIREYLPYIAIIIVFTSYIIGHSFNLALERIVFWASEEMYSQRLLLFEGNELNNNQIEIISETYSGLVMFRHLIISIAVFGIIFLVWMNRSSWKKFRCHIVFIIIILEILFILAYCAAREMLIGMK